MSRPLSPTARQHPRAGSDPGQPEAPALAKRTGLDLTVIALRWAGLRAGELCTLPTAGLDLARQQITVTGKGSKQRTIPLPDILADHLNHYLDVVRPTVPGTTLLFSNPEGLQPGQPLTGRASLDLCRRLGVTTGIAGPHTAIRWRHTYASSSLARGVDLHAVSRLLGHARVETSQRYLHLETAQLSNAIQRAYPRPEETGTTDSAGGAPS